MLCVVLIEQRDNSHHELGAVLTEDPDLGSLANRGLVVQLLRRHHRSVHPDHTQVLAYIDDRRHARVWRARTLLHEQ